MIEMMPTDLEHGPEIDRIIRTINSVTKNEDPDILAQALSFYLFGVVGTIHKLEPGIEIVKFCAKYFENYAEQLKWGGSLDRRKL